MAALGDRMSEAEPHHEPLSPEQLLRANLLLFQAMWRLSAAAPPDGPED